MFTVLVPVHGEEFSTAIMMMRDWFHRNRCEPVGYRYDQDEDTVFMSIDFNVPAQAAAFAECFGGQSVDQRGRISDLDDHLLSHEAELGSDGDHGKRPPRVWAIDEAKLVSDPAEQP